MARRTISFLLLISLLVTPGCVARDAAAPARDAELDRLRTAVTELQARFDAVAAERDLLAARLAADGERLLDLRHEPYETLPEVVRAWVDRLTGSGRIGACRLFGDRVYFVVSWQPAGEVAEVALSLSRVIDRGGIVDVVAWVGPAWGQRPHFAVGSVDAGGWPDPHEVSFRLEGSLIPFANRLGLPEIPLPAGERIALVTPTPGQAVTSPLRVAGFATLFEGWVAIRLLDGDGKELAAGGAACGFYTWDSFETTLEFAAPPGGDLMLVLEETATEGDAGPYGVRVPLKSGR